MSNILIDTHIFRKLFAEYRDLLDCITISSDTVILTPPIEAEYKGRHDPSPLAYRGYKLKLGEVIALRPIPGNRVLARNKRYKRKMKMPSHPKDEKWVEAAISEEAKHIISRDPHLSIPPFPTNSEMCTPVSPSQYIEENCT